MCVDPIRALVDLFSLIPFFSVVSGTTGGYGNTRIRGKEERMERRVWERTSNSEFKSTGLLVPRYVTIIIYF